MKKYNFIMLLCSLLFISNPISTYAEDIPAAASNDLEYRMRLQENAVNANEALNQAFGFDEEGNILFPDEFAGVWIDEDMLVISLTDTSDTVISKYNQWVGKYSDYVRFQKAQYSYNYLKNCAPSIIDTLSSEKQVNINGYYISETDNQIVIKVSENQSSRNVSDYDICDMDFEVPVRFETSKPVQTMSTTLEYGAKLCNAALSTPRYCTLGACGSYQSQAAIVTCGHGDQTLYDIFKYQDSDGETIGTLRYLRYQNNQYGDFSFIIVDLTKFSISNDMVTGEEITGTNSSPAVNTIVKLYGDATGVPVYAVVEERGVEETIDDVTIKGLTKTEFLDGGSATYGDSGGPVYQETTNGANFCGIITACYIFDSTPVFLYFTPYSYISAAGFTALTR